MNKDFLSQEEIDALINGTSKPATGSINAEDYLSPMEQDALGEIGNISFGTAATTLSTLLRQPVRITTPEVTLVRLEEVAQNFPMPHLAAQVEYTAGLVGANVLAIELDDAKIIADLMLGGDGLSPIDEVNELHISAVGEAMNQMMGSASTSMSSMLNQVINISPPKVEIVDFKEASHLFSSSPDVVVKVSFHLQVGELIDSSIMQLLPTDFARSLVHMLMKVNGSAPEPVAPPAPQVAAMPRTDTRAMETMVSAYARTAANETAAAAGVMDPPTQVQGSSVGGMGNLRTGPTPVVERAVFSEFDTPPAGVSGGRNLELLLDIPLGLTVELGRTKRMIRDILDLTPGSIVELDTLAGEPVDILVNNKLIARGEVVVIDENFGVRVTDILTPAERIRRLQ